MAKVTKKSQAATGSLEGLEELQNDGSIVKIGKEEIKIKPFTFGQLLKALKYLSNIGDVMSADIGEASIIRALSTNAEDVIGLLMLSTGKSREFFDELDAGAGIDIAVATYKVNNDFFVQTLTPKLSQLGLSTPPETPENTNNQSNETGSTSSSN